MNHKRKPKKKLSKRQIRGQQQLEALTLIERLKKELEEAKQ